MNKAVFLDRDGTIIVDKHYMYRPEEVEYIDGALEGMRRLCEAGYLLIIITNQSGIARGYYSEKDYLKLDEWMKNDLKSNGIRIAASYYCPHLSDGIVPQYTRECDCRKPKTALFWQAAKDLVIDMGLSYAVGDRERDISISHESGVKGIILSKEEINSPETVTCSDWRQVTEIILNGS